MTEKRLVVHQSLMPVVVVPESFQHCDIIEVRVTLTPLRWHQASERHLRDDKSEIVGSVVHIAQLESQDSRAVFSIVRQMLRALFAEYLGMKDLL